MQKREKESRKKQKTFDIKEVKLRPGITAQQLPIILQDFFTYRLNYLPLHYLFIFMLGGLAAVKEKEFFKTLTGNFKSVSTLYLLSIINIGGSYYYSYYQYGTT